MLKPNIENKIDKGKFSSYVFDLMFWEFSTSSAQQQKKNSSAQNVQKTV